MPHRGPRRKRLRNRITSLVGLMAMLTALVLGVYASVQTVSATIDTAQDGLRWETRLVAQRVASAIDEVASDGRIVLQTPPILGILRSTLNGGLDPRDGSHLADWKDRLGAIFAGVMRIRTDYLQMRYIQIAGGGPELVRVNRTPSGPVRVPEDQLQLKGAEPYVRAGAGLPPGGIHISPVTLNREHGAPDGTGTATLRVVLPVVQEDTTFGLIVINIDYFAMLARVAASAQSNKIVTVTNRAGDYLTYDGTSHTTRIGFSSDPAYVQPPFVATLRATSQPETTFPDIDVDGTSMAGFALRLPEGDRPSAGLTVALRVPRSVMLADAVTIRHRILAIAALMILGCTVFAASVAQVLTRPLRDMTDRILEAGGASPRGLPLTRKDEIGDLARSFDWMARSLAASEAQSHTVLNTVADGILMIDTSGVIQTVNPAAEAMFGYTSAELVGQDIAMLMPRQFRAAHPDHVAGFVPSAGHIHRPGQIMGHGREITGLRRDGTELPLEISINAARVDGHELITGVLRDITERREVDRLKMEFISTVSHELRTPLTSILGAFGLLRFRLQTVLDDQSRRLLDIAQDNSQKLTRLVNDILDMEKIGLGQVDYQIERVGIVALVADCLAHHKGYADQHGVHLNFDPPDDSPDCLIDPGRFEQAMANLLSNAAKFANPGTDVTVAVTLPEPGRVHITVSNFGPGIPKEFAPRVFQKFAQADASATRAKGGTGLGLSITKAIVEAFDGHIGFTSEPDGVTEFWIDLPRVDAPHSERVAG